MHVQVKRSGGLTGVERSGEINTSAQDDDREWQALVQRAVAETTPPVGLPDAFTYQITVDNETVYCAERQLTESQRQLISHVLGKEG